MKTRIFASILTRPIPQLYIEGERITRTVQIQADEWKTGTTTVSMDIFAEVADKMTTNEHWMDECTVLGNAIREETAHDTGGLQNH
jgi:hypothetical protein